MPQPREHATQRSLLTRTDEMVDATRVTVDEARWQAEQAGKREETVAASRRARRPVGLTLLVLPERRCARCEHWEFPSIKPPPKHVPVNPFGDCDQTVVLTERIRNPAMEKGQLLTGAEVQRFRSAGIWIGGDVSEPLRTMGHFGCSQFQTVSDIRHDPDADLTDMQREALERATQWAS